jgi:hypothetical protein
VAETNWTRPRRRDSSNKSVLLVDFWFRISKMKIAIPRHWLAAAVAIASFAGAVYPASAHAADPFVLFVLRMLRDQVVSSAIEAGASARPAPGYPGFAPAPPAATESERLKGLIDESFIHLGSQQRAELHASLMQMLDEPANAAQRPAILAEFTSQATALRNAHRQLSRLDESQLRRIASEAAEEFARLPSDQRLPLMQALERGIPGLPRTLSELMLAEFRSTAAR